MEAFAADFFGPKAFLTMFSPPASLGIVSAAAFALVTRVEPIFSSFSLLMARCRIVRACIVYQYMLRPNFVHNAAYIASRESALTYWRHFGIPESDWDASDSERPLGKVNWPQCLVLILGGTFGAVDICSSCCQSS